MITLEENFFAGVESALQRIDMPADVIEEVKQILRDRLFVRRGAGQAKISEYAGRGDLGRWLRMVAVREALAIVKAGERAVMAPDEFWALLADPAVDVELDHLKKLYRDEFKKSLQEAIRLLGARERYLLRIYFVEKAGIDEISRIQRIHRSTAARRLARARQSLLSRLRRCFLKNLQIGKAEAQSILHLIESQLEVSLRPLLVESIEEAMPDNH
jgi:RNA polymerase sigma-70 factor (ECF subfamily)